MTRQERIARDLAAVLSPRGEADWRAYFAMAEEVGIRLLQQFPDFMSPDAAHLDGHLGHRELNQPISAPPGRRL